ncbi:hypothetical protein P3S38_29520, partial [Enterobacter hormaechei]|uniref:hypothetical protein n=1 Tax=Enterobacter hormaechei TaxID=158836 RepID=UPI0023E3923E
MMEHQKKVQIVIDLTEVESLLQMSLTIFFKNNGIKRKLLATKTLEQNGTTKTRNRIVRKAAKAMVFENDISKI